MRKSCGVSEFEFPDLIPQYEHEALKDLFDFEAGEKQAQQEHCLKINTFEPYATKTILEALRAVERPIENQGYLFETKSDQLQRTSALMKTLSQKKVEDPESISDIQKQLSMDKVDNVHKTPVQLNDERPEVDLKHITIEENEQSLEFQPTQTHEDNEETSEPSVYAGQAASGIESSITQKEQEPKVMSTQLQMNPDHDDEEKTSQIHVDPHFDDAFISDSIAVRNSSQIEKLIVPKSDFNTSQPAFIEDSIPKYKQYSQKFPRSLPKNPISRQLESQDFDLFENEHLSKPYMDVKQQNNEYETFKQTSQNFELDVQNQNAQKNQFDKNVNQKQKCEVVNNLSQLTQHINAFSQNQKTVEELQLSNIDLKNEFESESDILFYNFNNKQLQIKLDRKNIQFQDYELKITLQCLNKEQIEIKCKDFQEYLEKRSELTKHFMKGKCETIVDKKFKQIIVKKCGVTVKRIDTMKSLVKVTDNVTHFKILVQGQIEHEFTVDKTSEGISIRRDLRETGAKFE
ncbi:Hypothetical_protein [Hexamita inflata]|uniref:Hypothetical_protein n=1 Tax=Hexamita inflata TaxID=28002 RepID=A0AA86P3Y5_9EUKA|nr:Hypothetical protein HINF_LOCUS18560 [Hexamita inflata]